MATADAFRSSTTRPVGLRRRGDLGLWARPGRQGRPDWITRATEAGAINRSPRTVAQAVYEDRG
jgi:hypothetical protein